MKKQKVDNSGQEAAQRALANSQAIANNLQKNFQTDLKNENLTQVVTGGELATDALDTGGVRRKRTQPGLASALGINV